MSDYDLLPDDVNYSYAQQRAVFKKPLTTIEVFKELIAQRLSQVRYLNFNAIRTYGQIFLIHQGFQMIVVPSSDAAGRTTRASSTEVSQTAPAANSSSSNTGSLLRSKSRNNDNEAHEEYMLSIGRLFHKIALKGNSIHVTRYRPRWIKWDVYTLWQFLMQ